MSSNWDSVLAALSTAGKAAAATGLDALTGGIAAKVQTAPATTVPSQGVATVTPYDVESVAAMRQAEADAVAKANAAILAAQGRGNFRAGVAVVGIVAAVAGGLYLLNRRG